MFRGCFCAACWGARESPQPLLDYFREIFFRSPFASAEHPSLVYLDQGKLVGFLGVLARDMEFRGQRIKAAVTSQLIVDRARHRGFAAIEMLRRFLRGPQDLSFTDGAGGPVHLLWSSAGAQPSRLYSFNWARPLRPFGMVGSFGARMGPLGKVAGVAAAPLDFLASRLPLPALRPPRSECVSTPLNSSEMYRCMLEVGWREALKPCHQLSSFEWLMAQTAANPIGELSMTAVHKQDGELCGYYICQVKRGGAASVLQIGTRRHDQFDQVLGALFRDAWERGATFVKGQAIPSALVNLTDHYCLFRQAHTCVVFQARDPRLENAILRGDAALSRLDGECWLRFATEKWV